MAKNNKAGKTAKKAPWLTKLTFKALPDDIIIPVMGPTGAGKSTFINYLARDAVKVGHDLKSCTTALQPVVITSLQHPQLGGQRLIMLDTPGFEDTYLPDSDILRCIALWLANVYNSDMKLSGIIFLHDISQIRLHGTTCKNLEVFQMLCGDDAFRSVILGTTGWSDILDEDGDMRTQQLRDNYWRDMSDLGSKIFKFEDSPKSAWKMVDSIVELNRSRGQVLQIQPELVEGLTRIPDTETGQKLRRNLGQVLKKKKAHRKAQKKDECKYLELDHEPSQAREQMKFMQVPVSQRVLGFLSLAIDKILDAVALSPPADSTTTRLGIKCDRGFFDKKIRLFGENREAKNMLLKLLSAQGVNVGNDQNAPRKEIKCWSVGTNEETSIIIDTPDFDSSLNPGQVVQKTRTWLETSCREDMVLGVVYLKLINGLDPSSSPESPPTRSLDIDSSPSGTGAVSLQANKSPTPAPFSRDISRRHESTLPLDQSLSNTRLVSNVPPNLLTVRDTKTDTSIQPSTAFVSPPAKDVHSSSITQRSYDTSPPPASNEEPPTTILWRNDGISSVTTVPCRPVTTVAGHRVPAKLMVSPGLTPRFRRSKGSQLTPSLTHLPAGIAGSSLSAMALFQGLPSADPILFATLTITPKTQTSAEASEPDGMSYCYASDGKVVEFQNTPEAAQAMLHLSLEKTLPVGVLLDALISLDAETASKGGKLKHKLGRFGRQIQSIR